MPRAFSYLLILRAAAMLLLSCGICHAMDQGDPPARAARLNYTEGNVTYAAAGDNEWTDADLNRPLVPGDKLWTDKGVRADIQVGSSIVRMDSRTQLAVLVLADASSQLSLTQGTVYLRVRSLPEGENFEVDTPNLAYRAAYPGDYRIDVDAQRGVTRVTIHSGTGAVYGENGQALPMGGGQQITFKGRVLEKVDVQEQPPQDNFDRWAAERNRREDQSVAARYVPRDAVGYQLLDASGEWRQDVNYGPVWYPQGVPASWAPYRNGRWEWIAPWGWTWIDDAPWAFVTSHYGRWAVIANRWAWAPGRLGLKPVYAPALVAFVGNGNSPLAIGGRQAVAWFPLAPGEAWQPAFRATPLYISSANANMPPLKEGAYAYQRKPQAITAMALDDFQGGRPSKAGALRVAANTIANAQVTAPPAMPEHPRTLVAQPNAPVQAPEVRQVTNNAPTLEQQIAGQRQVQREAEAQRQQAAQLELERLQREQQAQGEQRRAQQQKIAQQPRVAEQPRLAEPVRRAEQQQAAREQQHIAAQSRHAEPQRGAVQQHARAEATRAAAPRRATPPPVRHETVAGHAEQAKRELQARREETRERELQARRAQENRRLTAALAKKDEQARQAARVQQLAQARRAADRDAQVLAQQRAQRDAWQKQQESLAEQFRRDQQAFDEQQRAKAQRARPDLRKASPAAPPEVWDRGIPILPPGRTS